MTPIPRPLVSLLLKDKVGHHAKKKSKNSCSHGYCEHILVNINQKRNRWTLLTPLPFCSNPDTFCWLWKLKMMTAPSGPFNSLSSFPFGLNLWPPTQFAFLYLARLQWTNKHVSTSVTMQQSIYLQQCHSAIWSPPLVFWQQFYSQSGWKYFRRKLPSFLLFDSIDYH